MVQRDQFPDDVVDIEQYKQLLAALENADAVTIDGTITSSEAFGKSEFNQVVSVAPNTSETIINYAPNDGEAVSGISGNGSSDGRFTLKINGTEQVVQLTNQSNPNADYMFPNPIQVSSSDNVTLEVENVGLDSSDYTGMVMIQL